AVILIAAGGLPVLYDACVGTNRRSADGRRAAVYRVGSADGRARPFARSGIRIVRLRTDLSPCTDELRHLLEEELGFADPDRSPVSAHGGVRRMADRKSVV